jgi:hypothetical protein
MDSDGAPPSDQILARGIAPSDSASEASNDNATTNNENHANTPPSTTVVFSTTRADQHGFASPYAYPGPLYMTNATQTTTPNPYIALPALLWENPPPRSAATRPWRRGGSSSRSWTGRSMWEASGEARGGGLRVPGRAFVSANWRQDREERDARDRSSWRGGNDQWVGGM